MRLFTHPLSPPPPPSLPFPQPAAYSQKKGNGIDNKEEKGTPRVAVAPEPARGSQAGFDSPDVMAVFAKCVRYRIYV